jgi:hypothetical protein
MARCFFDLEGQVPAHDIVGQEHPDHKAALAARHNEFGDIADAIRRGRGPLRR